MAERISIVTDSNSGITQALAKELGVFVVPMPFVIDGETFFEDINLTQAAFYERLKDDADISTSQPAVAKTSWTNSKSAALATPSPAEPVMATRTVCPDSLGRKSRSISAVFSRTLDI